MDQNTRNTIRLLIVDSEAAEAEAILNVFRDAGNATRGEHIISASSLEKALSERRKWDLILVSELPDGLTMAALGDMMALQGQDIPIIVLADYADASETLEYIKLGVSAVVPRDNDEHLLLAANKEVDELRIRRHYRRMSVVLNESEKQRRMLLDDQIDALLYITEGFVSYANPAFMNMLGIKSKDELIGKPFKELVIDNESEQVHEFLVSVENTGQAIAAIQCHLSAGNNKEFQVRIIVSPTSFEGGYTLSLLVRAEKTEQEKVPEASVDKASVMAPISDTGLFDKSQFQKQLDVALQRVVADKGKAALLCLTLDTFKAIHKKGGHKISLPMLQNLSQILSGQLAEGHYAANWGNGIFMVLLNSGEKKKVQDIADGIIKTVGNNIQVGNNHLPVRLSLGGVLLSDTSNDVKTLLVRARHAATQSLKEGGGKLVFCQQRKINAASSVEKHLAGMVSQALKNDNIRLFYQPVVSLKGSPEEYYEVSLRITDIRGREHDTSAFQARLERNSLWGKLDRWQLIQASKDLITKRRNGHDTRLIFQLGACEIIDSSFVPWVGVALKAAGIPPKAVVFEIREPNLTRFQKEVPAFFQSLKNMGYQTGVSHFGCSLKPVDALESLDVDLVKVDQSFTKDITSPDKGKELEHMITQLAGKQCKVIVPQVASAAEMAPLWQSGVDYIQGPFLQTPTKEMTFDFGSDI